MFTNMAFLGPFLVNQFASIMNNFVIANHDLSVTVPVVNCVTFITTFIVMRLLKDQTLIDVKFFAGTAFIVAGLYFAMTPEHVF